MTVSFGGTIFVYCTTHLRCWKRSFIELDMEKHYKATMDIRAVVITLVVMIILFGAAINQLYDIVIAHQGNPIVKTGSTLLAISILVLCYFISPSKYILTEKYLIIKRPIGSINIGLSDIKSVRKIDRKSLKGTIRLFGIGGVFGYTGAFYNSRLGKFTSYSTQYRNLFFIITSRKNVLISPNDVDLYAELLERCKNQL